MKKIRVIVWSRWLGISQQPFCFLFNGLSESRSTFATFNRKASNKSYWAQNVGILTKMKRIKSLTQLRTVLPSLAWDEKKSLFDASIWWVKDLTVPMVTEFSASQGRFFRTWSLLFQSSSSPLTLCFRAVFKLLGNVWATFQIWSNF